MPHPILSTVLAESAPIHTRPWDLNPVLSPWLLIPGAILACVAVFYLYRAQQRIASRPIVNTLTVIRTLLIVLVFVMLLGPVLQWATTRHSNGTLWVVLDESLSMKQTDPQSTPAERLHWADALGYLPADLAAPKLNSHIARLSALRDDLENDKSRAGLLLNDEKGEKQLKDLSDAFKKWNSQLTEQADALDQDAAVKAKPEIGQELRKAIGVGTQASTALDSAKPEDAAAAIPAQALHDSLSSAITRLEPLARDADAAYLRDHGSDNRVQDALNKVKALSRADLAYAALTGKSTHGLKSLAESMGRQEVKIVPIGATPDAASGEARRLITPEKPELTAALQTLLKDPKGKNTDIAEALQYVGDQLGEDSTVLVVSDGRQNVGSNPEEPAQFLASRGARVFTLAIGSHQTAHDAAVDHIDAPDWVYVEDNVVVSPVLRLDGLKDREVTVEFRRGKDVLETRKIKAKADQDKVRLRFTDKPPQEGLFDYEVAILPVPDEAVLDNNAQSVRVAVKKDKLNVLLVEDEPRWEYQFLRNYLVRDHRVKLQVVLVDAAHIENVAPSGAVKASPKREENQIDAQVLPATREEWSGFDIVILGDVPPEKLPAEQQKNLTAALRDGGVKGLLAISGSRNMPMRYAGTPLADVLPVELSGSKWTPQELSEQLRRGYQPSEAPEGLSSILSQFSEDPGLNAELWASVPVWYWHSELTVARPGASVIWTIQDPSLARARSAAGQPNAAAAGTPDEMESLRQHALLTTMNVGLGRVMYLASPETWRLRYVQTPGADSHIEDLHRRFWGQVVRWAAGSDLPAGGKFVKFGTNKPSYIGGEPIVVTARVLKEDFTPLQQQTFKIVATKKGAPGAQQAGEASMVEAPTEGAGIYRGTLTLPAGSYVLSVKGGEPERLLAADPAANPTLQTLQIDVQPNATVEDRDVNSDPERMAAIGRAGSGVALDGPYFDALANHLPVIDHTETKISQAGLFSDAKDPRTSLTHWIFFGVIALLLTAEWILRKRGGLV